MTLKLSTRLWLPTVTMSCLLLLLGGIVWHTTRSDLAASNAELKSQENKVQDAATWQGLTTANVARVMASVISADPDVEKALKPEIEATTAAITEIQKRIEAAATSDEEKAALARTTDARKAYIAARSEAVKIKADGDVDKAKELLANQVHPTVVAYMASQRAYVVLQLARSEQVRENAGERRLNVSKHAAFTLALALLAIAFATFSLVRSICRPLNTLGEIARRIGEGDLDVEVPAHRADEVGAVMASLTTMRNALRGIVGQVRQSAESIQVASAEVASGNLDLSLRTEQASSHLEHTASSLEQLTQNVRQSAGAATQAHQLATAASAVAQRGGVAVSQVVTTMNEINASSKRIADIVGTIDAIAFQTNILALNAAVEAARAGEQGRGFAVVAGEVRSLAQRSAEAAREIKSLIGASVERVQQGAKLVQDAGATVGEIVTSVQRVTDVISEITAAASEQSGGIGQVNGAVGSLDEMTRQNAALVEQSAAAAESLRDQAQRLSQAMQVFKLSGTGGHAASAAAPASPSARPGISPLKTSQTGPAKTPLSSPAKPAAATPASPAGRQPPPLRATPKAVLKAAPTATPTPAPITAPTTAHRPAPVVAAAAATQAVAAAAVTTAGANDDWESF